MCVVPVLFLSALHAVFVCSAADECETTGHSPEFVLLHSVMHKNIKTFELLLIQLIGFNCLSLNPSPCLCAVAVVRKVALLMPDFLSAPENKIERVLNIQ